MSLAYAEALVELARGNDDIVVMTAENRAPLRGVPERLGSRFIDVGICEQTLIGAAAGLALRGRRPVVHALAAFLTMRAFEFIRTDVALARLPVTLVGYVPGFLSEANGPTHQATEDIALMRSIPGMRVVCPADEWELLQCLPEILGTPSPCYIRFHGAPATVAHKTPYRLGQSETLREGTDITLLSYGLLVGEVCRAADFLTAGGVSTRVVNLRSLEPVDEEAISAAARETSMLLTVEDHNLRGGLFTIVAETLLHRGLTARVFPMALNGMGFVPALLEEVLTYEGFKAQNIAECAQELVEEARPRSEVIHA